jgi:hypothetical protein
MKKRAILYGLVSFSVIFISMVIGGRILKALNLNDGLVSLVILAAVSGMISVFSVKKLLD